MTGEDDGAGIRERMLGERMEGRERALKEAGLLLDTLSDPTEDDANTFFHWKALAKLARQEAKRVKGEVEKFV